jgi:hypothetical protein
VIVLVLRREMEVEGKGNGRRKREFCGIRREKKSVEGDLRDK